MGQSSMIQVSNLSKTYTMGHKRFKALDNIDLTIQKNDFVAIMGQSGSGKSTLMNVLGCLAQADSGDYQLDGESVAQLTDDALARIRNEKIGFVFQSFNLQTRRTALDNVLLPCRFSSDKPEQIRVRAEALLKRVGLESRMNHKPGELSGGQRQRVAIARALINQPSIILADEPTGNLDSKTTLEIMSLFNELHQSGQTIIMVTHEDEIAAYAKKVIWLKDGQIVKVEHND
ncbi:ABC transporter ATP-binding protein [Pleionea sediminis]|uniref:ABC transporter ATP-binding protein n=1 Tax=Pleionea sediminis TaxID=2569479 RepID=UPI001FE32DF6|nr:ABC transporter ATP-binding protein [Pleionea sediminis]